MDFIFDVLENLVSKVIKTPLFMDKVRQRRQPIGCEMVKVVL
jgi:hypothetical protein